jgi:proteasome assembly chaperone (PAC2) family protein
MSRLHEFIQNPELDSPVLIVVLDGWIDAGLGAAAAIEALTPSTPLDTVAVFDTDVLLDHRARRPTMHIADGITTGLTWPSIEMKAGADPEGRDVLFLLGAEPDHQWRAFSTDVVALALEMGCRMVVGLGAYPAPTPHTRPTRVIATTASPDLAGRVGVVHGHIDVPAGVQAAIEEHAHEVGLPSVGLWAQVPHYASAMPSPSASAALVDGLAAVADLTIPSDDLHRQAQTLRTRLDELVAANPEHVDMVRQLEEQWDEEAAGGQGLGGQTSSGGFGIGPLPSGDELAAELERFLRDQGNETT